MDKANRSLLANRQQLDSLEMSAGKKPGGDEETLQAVQAAVREWNTKVGLSQQGEQQSLFSS